jgi:hypothetical protein
VLWCFINFAAHERFTRHNVLVTPKCIRIFDSLLDTGNTEIIISLLWLCQNLVSDKKDVKNFFVTSPFYARIIMDLLNTDNIIIQVAQNIVTLIANVHKMMAGTLEPPNHVVEKSTEIVCSLFNYDDRDIKLDAAWALACITNSENQNVPNIISLNGTLEGIVNFMKNNLNCNKFKCAFLKTIGNLTSGKDTIIDYIISLEVPKLIVNFLNDPYFAIRREVLWTYANIAAGTKDHILYLMNQGYLDIVRAKLSDNNLIVVQEAAWCISNCVSGSDLDMKINLIAKHSIFEAFVECLHTSQEKIILLALDALRSIFGEYKKLKFGDNKSSNFFVEQFIKIGGGDILEKLQTTDNDKVYVEVTSLLKDFFPMNS